MRPVPSAILRLTRSFWRRHWLPLVAVALIGSVALAQGFQPGFIRNLVGPVTITGNTTGTGTATFSGTVTGSRVVATATSTQYACTGAGACGMASASGQNMAVDCGGGTCAATLGVTSATTTTVGRSGQTTNLNGSIAFGSTLPALTSSGNITTSSTSTPTLGCTGAAACNFGSASGQAATVDCGGGTCTANLGTAAATTTTVGRSGQTTNINGTTTFGGAVSLGSNNITTTGRYCTDVACTTAYITNDTFSTMNIIGSVGGSGNWSTAGSFNSDVYVKIGATSIGTCNAGAEGVTRRDSAGGGTTGHRTKLCLCTSDGAGTPAYAWTNLASGTVGTTTACND